MKKYLFLIGFMACLGLMGLTSAEAVQLTLEDVTAPGFSITIGDKVFSGFSAILTLEGNATPTSLSSLAFIPESENGLNGFQIFGPINAIAPPTSTVDIALEYDVTSLGAPITDYHLFFNGAGSGEIFSTSVVETIQAGLGDFGQEIGFMQVFANSWQPAVRTAFTEFAPVQSVHVTKDINAVAFETGRATISIIDQAASQVPEPATLLLIGTGLVGLAVYRRLKTN